MMVWIVYFCDENGTDTLGVIRDADSLTRRLYMLPWRRLRPTAWVAPAMFGVAKGELLLQAHVLDVLEDESWITPLRTEVSV